ncbi:MAG: hypothetical protein AB2820_07400 [Candidatus Thiodiazotropha sp.]
MRSKRRLKQARPDIEQLLREEYTEDNSSANGSSIAFLVEYDDYRVLLAGDAHPSTLGGIDQATWRGQG